jgi:hypothetical protein
MDLSVRAEADSGEQLHLSVRLLHALGAHGPAQRVGVLGAVRLHAARQAPGHRAPQTGPRRIEPCHRAPQAGPGSADRDAPRRIEPGPACSWHRTLPRRMEPGHLPRRMEPGRLPRRIEPGRLGAAQSSLLMGRRDACLAVRARTPTHPPATDAGLPGICSSKVGWATWAAWHLSIRETCSTALCGPWGLTRLKGGSYVWLPNWDQMSYSTCRIGSSVS